MPISVNDILADTERAIEKTAEIQGIQKEASGDLLASLSDEQILSVASEVEAGGEHRAAVGTMLDMRKRAREEASTPEASINREAKLRKLAYRTALREMGLLDKNGGLDPLRALFPGERNPRLKLAQLAAEACQNLIAQAFQGILPDAQSRGGE